jgi:glycosyltransferase involved in cell wall biosynthesis
MPSPSPQQFSDAVWIAAVDDVDVANGRVSFAGLPGYRTARLLVRSGRHPRGFVELPITATGVDSRQAAEAVDALPPAPHVLRTGNPPISVVLCTFNRSVLLAQALRSLLLLDYPDFEIVVVDNDPASGVTQPVVHALADPRIRVVAEPRRGLARARNTGLLATRHDLVAFTDDDVLIDSYWLQGIADGFEAGDDVACVTGIVPSGEIASASQAYFDRRVSWARNCSREVFSLARSPQDEPLFPFQVGRFGTGANFAARRGLLLELGGFDEGLGAGSPCGGGEDIDLFVRVLLAGHELAYEPAALVWHKHRSDAQSLTLQITDYGTGLGAWMTKLALSPRTLLMMLRRLVPGVRHLRRVTHPDRPRGDLSREHEFLWRIERRAVLRGPIALARSRAAGARARPLTTGHTARSTRPADTPTETR